MNTYATTSNLVTGLNESTGSLSPELMEKMKEWILIPNEMRNLMAFNMLLRKLGVSETRRIILSLQTKKNGLIGIEFLNYFTEENKVNTRWSIKIRKQLT